MIKIIINRVPAIITSFLKVSIERGMGIRRTISMSNTKKITARRKNRRENGRRAEFLGSKPHSNGDDFSRSEEDRAENTMAAVRIRVGNRRASIAKSQ